MNRSGIEQVGDRSLRWGKSVPLYLSKSVVSSKIEKSKNSVVCQNKLKQAETMREEREPFDQMDALNSIRISQVMNEKPRKDTSVKLQGKQSTITNQENIGATPGLVDKKH